MPNPDSHSNLLRRWLDRSPIATALVVSAAVLGFVISALNGGYTIYKEIAERRLIPQISEFGVSFRSEELEIEANLLEGMGTPGGSGNTSPQPGGPEIKRRGTIRMPLVGTVLLMTNPRNEPATIVRLELKIRFQPGEWHWSDYYLLADPTGPRITEMKPPIRLGPHEAKRVSIHFLFLPSAEFLNSRGGSAAEREPGFALAWYDDAGRRGETPTVNFSRDAK
jgi:hypothetical protein